jgi:pimeloyl-ACP methyl ester carboxylesterase
MNPLPALVLLSTAADSAAGWDAYRPALTGAFRLLTPELPDLVTGSGAPSESRQSDSAIVRRGADAAFGAIDAAGFSSAFVCGCGLGAVLALAVAGRWPERVDGLVLVANQVRLAPILMSLPAALTRLLPAATLERLGIGSGQVIALLDQVRPADFRPLAAQVRGPALVVCGQYDRINLRVSAELARALPNGELRILPRAEPGWRYEHPQMLIQLLLEVAGGQR